MMQYLVFVVLVIRGQGLDDLIMIQQPGRIPGIFCQDKVH